MGARGPKPGQKVGGRQKGTPNKRTVQREAKVQEAAAAIADVIPDAFEGDGHALLMAIYKDPRYDIGVRLDAAKAAIAYEKPRLQAIEANVDHAGSMTLNIITGVPARDDFGESWGLKEAYR